MQAGAAGIIVSNHGARQLDYVPATINALEEVCACIYFLYKEINIIVFTPIVSWLTMCKKFWCLVKAENFELKIMKKF